jgi:hypothetical protein
MIFGRTPPVQPDLDALFALPSASISLQSSAGLVCSGHGGVCFKAPSGQGFAAMQNDVANLLSLEPSDVFTRAEDSFGYQWLVLADTDIEQLVTNIHLVNSSLSDAGWGTQLLCSVFGLAPVPAGHPEGQAGPGVLLPSASYLVYLYKRGAFYPFVPTGHEQRDMEEELRLKSLVADDLKVEPELDRWFPLWDLPLP